MFAERAREDGVPIAFCGLVGGQDELLFDGHSFVVDRTGETIARAAQFEEDLLVCDVDLDGAARPLDGSDRAPGQSAKPPLVALPGYSPTPRTAAGARRLSEPIAPEEAEIYSGADARAARLRREERVLATSSSVSPEGSIPRSSPAWPPMRSAPSV